MAYETVKNLTTSATSELSSQAGKVEGELLPPTENLADQTAQQVGGLYAQGTNRARESLDELPATLSDASMVGGRLIRHVRRRIDHSVRKQPVEALLLAGALGYLAGWAASRG